VQQEQYTRPHVGTGDGILDLTTGLVKLRRDTIDKRRPRSEPSRRPPPPKGHHVIGDKARPMTVHAPRHKDMDPNNPRNLKKMKPKTEEYTPYPPPEGSLTLNHLIISKKNDQNSPCGN